MGKTTITKNKKRELRTQRTIASKGIYEDGVIKLTGEKLPKKKMNVVVTFREDKKDKTYNSKNVVDSFLKKWSGVLKTNNVELVMEKKLEYLVEKHK